MLLYRVDRYWKAHARKLLCASANALLAFSTAGISCLQVAAAWCAYPQTPHICLLQDVLQYCGYLLETQLITQANNQLQDCELRRDFKAQLRL
jgi:hypothetical protein